MAHPEAHSSARLEGGWGIKIVEIAGNVFIELVSNRKSTLLTNHPKKYVNSVSCARSGGSIAGTSIDFVPMGS